MGKGDKKKRKKKAAKRGKAALHRHYLYSAAVQSVEADLKFFRRVYKKKNGSPFRRLREDFCGTALLACDWVRRGSDHEAWGVDLDRSTLDWGLEHYARRLGRGKSRLHLSCRDVREVSGPKVDLVAALNFSYSVFQTRAELGGYFAGVRESLTPGGVFVLDAWGGTESMIEDRETRKIDSERAFDGTKIPAFTYIWEQKRFNPVDHHAVCQIHFRLPGGAKLTRAFVYEWRLWTLPELRELLHEAGFAGSEVYVEGWDDDEDEADGVFRRRTHFENHEGWVAYVVGYC